MITLDHVELSFDRPILKGINLAINEGEIIGIVGKSGAGKSSLLQIIAGLLDASAGCVRLNGEVVKGPSSRLIPGHPEIQLVNQDFQLDVYHTVQENIRECILNLPEKLRVQFVDELLELLELTEVRSQKAHTLSGGEQQRLSIARALAKEPKVLLLDEPFSHIDGRLRMKLITYLLELRRVRQMTLLLVSHDGSDVLSLSDRIFWMKNGQFIRNGTPRKMYYSYKTLEDARLFGHVNSVKVDERRVYFRPDEFTCVDTAEKSFDLEISYVHAQFHGPWLHTLFRTKANEMILLYSLEPIAHVQFITIQKKSF